jgi:serine/threonine protein kinase
MVIVGQKLGAYEVVAKLGEGGMGEVYRARDPKLHREVAIKVLPGLFASDPARLIRFEREAQTLAPSIIRTSRKSTASSSSRRPW